MRSVWQDVPVFAGARSYPAQELSWQSSLFGAVAPGFDPTFASIERHCLDQFSWIDRLPGWLNGSDLLFCDLVASLPWRQREVRMWDRRLDEPRLTCWWDGAAQCPGAALAPGAPPPLLIEMRAALAAHYNRRFDSIGFNLYRDGRDSVAWHGDRERYTHEQPVVAIVSIGAARTFMLRPRGGGPSSSYRLGRGDLLVMGGACQHDWEHCVPKVAKADGPRLSIMFRHDLAGFTPPG